jgi:hypothetical protein
MVKLEGIWKEMVTVVSRYLPEICLDRLKKSLKPALTATVLAKNRIVPIPYIRVISKPNSLV